MRHRIGGKQLNRTSEHRRAMFRNLAAGLFEHGQIETTLPKAKAVQPYVEKIITLAKKGTFNARREITRRLNDRLIHAWVADPNVPDSKKDNPYFDLPDQGDIEFNRFGEVRKAPRLVQHVMTQVAERFQDRDGGYTRIIRTGRHRLGDGGEIVLLQLVGEEEGPEVGGSHSGRRDQANRRAAFAAKLRKAARGAADVDETGAATAVAEPPADTADVPDDAAAEDQASPQDTAEETGPDDAEKKD